ncbi:hypothetical protein Q7P37_005284 [Cladosporium fusiforme]
MHLLHLALIALTSTTTTLVSARKPPANAVLLSNIKTLTLHGNRDTSARRGPPVPQLSCVGGSAQGLYDVDMMRCNNAGADYGPEDVQWTCQASLPAEFKLGSTEVVCEGYDSPEDPFVLKGSCGVEYRLILTALGEEKYGQRQDYGRKGGSQEGRGKEGGLGEKLFTFVFWAIFLGIVALIVRSIWTGGGGGANANLNFGRRPGDGGGWGGGYGGGDGHDGHDEPPPPYSRHAPPRSKPTTRSSPSSSAWRPGFWSGAATGAAAGYAMGNRSNRAPNYGQPGPSNWFGNGGGPSRSFGGGGSSGGGSGSPSAPSGARHESTGFGGSRRR